MQIFAFVVLFLLTFAESSSVKAKSDLLSSVDIIAFNYSLSASEHWDCPRVGDRVAKAEEARIWQTVIPDARIKVVASGNKTLPKAEQYKWVNEPSSDPIMQSSVLLGMRKPDFDGNTAPVKVLYSKSKQVSQDALSAMLPQLEHSKDRILEWMARTQVPITSMTPRITDPLVDQRFRVSQAENYYPRVFKHPHFTTGDLVAGIALLAASRQKGHEDALKFFKLMAQSFLPGFSVSLGAVPTSSAGSPTRTVYLHRSFQDVPAGADLAFYFDGNHGKFLKTQNDSIMLNRPEDIVDGQQYAALILSLNASDDASSLEARQVSAGIAMRRVFYKELEKALALDIPSGATADKVQAICVATIRSRTAHLERDSFLEAQRKVLESKPTLLIKVLPASLVKLVIDYFNDETYPFIVSTHRWSLKDEPGIAVDSARLYVMADSEGLKGLNHSSANLEQDERHCIEFSHPHWSNCLWLTSSHDGRYVSFNHQYSASTDTGKQTVRSIKWLTQDSEDDGEGFKRIAFNGKDLPRGWLSRNGQTLLSHNGKRNFTGRVYRIKGEAEKNPTATMKFVLDGKPRAVSGRGNRVMMSSTRQLEIHDIGVGASKLVCRISRTDFIYIGALNDDGSKAACVSCTDELRVIEVDSVDGDNVDQPAIVSVNVPKSLGEIYQLVYSDSGKLHICHRGGKVSLFDPSTMTFAVIEAPQAGQTIISLMISPNADYIATLQCFGKENGENGRHFYKTIVKRKLIKADFKSLFGYEDDKEVVE